MSYSSLAVFWGIFGLVAVGALIYGAVDPTRAAVAPSLAGLSVFAGAAVTVVCRVTTRMELRGGQLIVCPVEARRRLRPFVQIRVDDIVSVTLDRFVMQIVDRHGHTTVAQATEFSRADLLHLLDALDQFGISTETDFRRA